MRPQSLRGQKCTAELLAMRLCKAPKRHLFRVGLVFSCAEAYHHILILFIGKTPMFFVL